MAVKTKSTKFPKFSKSIILRAKTFAAEDKEKYIMYAVKKNGEHTFYTRDNKLELQEFAKRQEFRAIKIVLAPKKVDPKSPHTMENRRKKWDKIRLVRD